MRDELEALSACVSGLLLIFFGNVGVSASFDIAFLLVFLGVLLTSVALLYLLATIELLPKLKVFSKRFKQNKSGVAWVWVTAALALAFCPFVYWAIGWPLDIVITQLMGQVTLTGFMATSFAAVRVVVAYLMGFVLIFTVIWAWVNARSPQYGG